MKVMIKKFVLQVLAFSLLETMIFAEEEKSNVVNLTVDQAVEFALKNSNSMKSADIDLAMKERAGKYGWNVLLPTVQATATMSRASEDAVSSNLPADIPIEITESMHWTGIVGVSASWNFSFAYIEQIRIAKKNYEVGQLSFEKSQREIKVNALL